MNYETISLAPDNIEATTASPDADAYRDVGEESL